MACSKIPSRRRGSIHSAGACGIRIARKMIFCFTNVTKMLDLNNKIIL